MSRISKQAGDSKLGCLIWILLFAIAILVAVKMIPVKLQSVELYDFMVEQAKWAANHKPDRIRRDILKKADELRIPLDRKNVRVERHGDRIIMQADYSVPVRFPFYTYVWEFHHLVDRPIYIF
jgi:hypothetical protein